MKAPGECSAHAPYHPRKMADKKELTADVVEELETKFRAIPKNELAQNAVAKHGLVDTMLSHKHIKGRVHAYNCTIPDEGKPVTNQKSSGRCWIFALLNCVRLVMFKIS